MYRAMGVCALMALGVLCMGPPAADSACCYFTAKDKDINQPAQKAFITWDPKEGVETFTVQPKFEGNALDFGMVIPTPGKPKLDEMPRDFFKELAVFTILKQRPQPKFNRAMMPGQAQMAQEKSNKDGGRPTTVKVLEEGIVGSLDYKIITAERADDLYSWLKDNKYSYAGDEATLDFYVKKKWLFTVMKIDTKQMKKNADGSFAGEVTPTRFQFTSEKLIYPLKITQLSVKDKTEALFYVQAPYKVDLPGDMTYQYQWVPMLQTAKGCCQLPGKADEWLNGIKDQTPALIKKGQELGFGFVAGQRPQPNKEGKIATTLEWAKLLTAEDVKLLKGEAPYSTPELSREAPEADVKQLKLLAGHLKEGQFLTKFRKTFTKAEMTDDLLIVPAQLGKVEDKSEHEEILPTSPP